VRFKEIRAGHRIRPTLRNQTQCRAVFTCVLPYSLKTCGPVGSRLRLERPVCARCDEIDHRIEHSKSSLLGSRTSNCCRVLQPQSLSSSKRRLRFTQAKVRPSWRPLNGRPTPS
jgi:hypothetical protein